VKGTVAGATTRKYYYLGAQRVAMLENSTVYYLLGDHLGSTALTVNSAGAKYGELRYKAFGETRYTFGTTPTSFGFTGQRQESGLGLYFYNARWYDPYLGVNIATKSDFNSIDFLVTSAVGGVSGIVGQAYATTLPRAIALGATLATAPTCTQKIAGHILLHGR
jgi:RHS repeat-associated protein